MKSGCSWKNPSCPITYRVRQHLTVWGKLTVRRNTPTFQESCSLKWPCSLIIQLTFDTTSDPSFGTILSLHFLHLVISVTLRQHPWIKSFFFPRGGSQWSWLGGAETTSWGEFANARAFVPVVPVIVKGYWHLMGGRCREGTHRTVPNDKDSMPKCKQHHAAGKHRKGKSISWPFIRYFWTPHSSAHCFSWCQISRSPVYTQDPKCVSLTLSLSVAPGSSCQLLRSISPWAVQAKIHPAVWQMVHLFCFSFIPAAKWLSSASSL